MDCTVVQQHNDCLADETETTQNSLKMSSCYLNTLGMYSLDLFLLVNTTVILHVIF